MLFSMAIYSIPAKHRLTFFISCAKIRNWLNWAQPKFDWQNICKIIAQDEKCTVKEGFVPWLRIAQNSLCTIDTRKRICEGERTRGSIKINWNASQLLFSLSSSSLAVKVIIVCVRARCFRSFIHIDGEIKPAHNCAHVAQDYDLLESMPFLMLIHGGNKSLWPNWMATATTTGPEQKNDDGWRMVWQCARWWWWRKCGYFWYDKSYTVRAPCIGWNSNCNKRMKNTCSSQFSAYANK